MSFPELIRQRTSRRCAAVASVFLAACAMMPGGASSQTRLAADLSGEAVVPPTASAARGRIEATLVGGDVLRYRVTYVGLSGPLTAARLHGPAMPGSNAGELAPLNRGASPIEGEVRLTAAQKADLLGGRCYASLFTAANPEGEIRGQLTVAK